MKELLSEFLTSILEDTKFKAVTTGKSPKVVYFSSAKTKAAAIKKGTHREYVPDKKPEKVDGRTTAQAKKSRAAAGRTSRQTSEPQTITPDEVQSAVDTAYSDASNDSRLDKLFGGIKHKVSKIRRMMALKMFENTVESRLPDDKKKQGRRLAKGIEALLEADARGDTKTARRIVKELRDEFNFYSNAAGKTFKTKAFGMGERHFLGKTVLAANMVELFDKYRPAGTPSIREAEDQDNATKQELSAASKARQGEYVTKTNRKGEQVRVFIPDAVNAVNSPRVKKILGGISIEDRFKALYGPKDESGDLLDNTGGKNSREYFRHSLERTISLDQTVRVLEQNGFPKMAQSVRDHKKRMEDILENWDSYTPEERETAVQQSYSDMAVRLHSTAHGGDSEMCSAIMKNLAEMSLYDSELAGGKEVYLPASGSFPAADKLIRIGGGTKAERIDKISVKFGKNGKVYGMPAQSSTIGLMHPDSFYHEITGGRVGIEGSETGVRSDVLEKNNWSRLIEDSGYGQCFTSKAATERVRKSFVNAQQVIKEERDKLRPQPPTIKALSLMMKNNKRIEEARRKIAEELSTGIDQAKLEKHGGPERVAMLRSPMAFASMMAMDASILSADGYPDLLHAHMVMEDGDADGAAENMRTVVEPGTPNLRNWHYLWREADERGGGLLMGYARSDEEDNDKDVTLSKPPKRSRGK